MPEAAEPPPCETVTPTPGVPVVRFRLSPTDELALPPDALAAGLRPERVFALGLADAFVFVDAGTFFDDFNVTVTSPRDRRRA